MEAMPKPDPTPRRRIANPHAWARYWRIMRWMTLLALTCVVVALIYFLFCYALSRYSRYLEQALNRDRRAA